MSDYLYLTDKQRCPVCFARRCFADGNCHNCGVRLFTSINIDFQKFEDETPIRLWWAWTPESGWKHRDHFMVQNARPNVRYSAPKIPDANYGRQTTPDQVAARGGKIRRTVRPR